MTIASLIIVRKTRIERPKPGTMFSGWEFIQEIFRRPEPLWKCRCVYCDRVEYPQARSVRTGRSTKCKFCSRKGPRKRKSAFDVMANPAMRRRWLNCHKAMVRRCNNPSDQAYVNYGGRGIEVCSDFLDKEKFATFIVTLPGWDNPLLQLDRVDNDGNYAPDNLRMATRSEQNKNKRHKSNGKEVLS